MLDVHRITTTSALLDGLFEDADGSTWREFDFRYRPIILGVARTLGLTDADAADVAQDALSQFVQDYRAGRYDRTRGRLRSWLIGIVRHRVFDLRRKQAVRREARGESALAGLAVEADCEAIWDTERRQVLLQQAIGELREHGRTHERTVRAFELYALAGRPVEEVAAELALTPQDVYMAKSNVAQRLRAILERLESLFDDA